LPIYALDGVTLQPISPNVARVCEVALEDKGFLVRKSNFANPLIGDVGSALARTRLSAGVTRATIGRNCERSEQFPSYLLHLRTLVRFIYQYGGICEL